VDGGLSSRSVDDGLSSRSCGRWLVINKLWMVACHQEAVIGGFVVIIASSSLQYISIPIL